LDEIGSPHPLGLAAGDANLYRYVGNMATMATDPSGQVIFIVLGIAVIGAALLNTNTGAEAVVTAGNFITGGSFSGWVAGPSNDWYGRFAHRVDRWSLTNQLGGLVAIISVGGAMRVPKEVTMPGAPSTTSIWTKVPGTSLATGQTLGRIFSRVVLFEGIYNIVMIPAVAIYTFFDGEDG
jgi:hypothetical protein